MTATNPVDELLVRLRDPAHYPRRPVMREAANEIERLRRLLHDALEANDRNSEQLDNLMEATRDDRAVQ